ncbi:DMT family transporter [Paenibacillus sp. LHD-117]|uniref:EamA family transporter n=1 Tax=Paenibacillus sp. LHD-117 TaxID=3071412 RepID=UPI0027DFC770|nr:DMT family transporter [Paenibacillus sp. LHD-117]MDQ6422197.1 DMT family transporter [Paenibacillus sp. LHD-117]
MAQRYAVLLVVIASVCYGLLATLTKLGLAGGLHVGQINGVQFIFGTILLWGTAIWKHRHWQKPSSRAILKLLAVGTLMGMTSAFYNAAIQFVPASIAVVLLFQFVWIGVLYEWIFRRVAPNGQTLVSIAISIVGALFAADVFHGKLLQISPAGVLLGLGAAFSYAGTLYTSGKVAMEVSSWLRGPIIATGGLAFILLLYPPVDLFKGAAWGGFWPLAGLLALLGMLVPTLCLMFGTPPISTGLTTVLGSAQLPVSVFMAWTIFAERVSGPQWLGVGLIIAGIVVAQWNREAGGKPAGGSSLRM